jgi:hypothetical protein
LSKKDSALVKLGSELKELEKIEERLENREEELAEEKRKVRQNNRVDDELI